VTMRMWCTHSRLLFNQKQLNIMKKTKENNRFSNQDYTFETNMPEAAVRVNRTLASYLMEISLPLIGSVSSMSVNETDASKENRLEFKSLNGILSSDLFDGIISRSLSRREYPRSGNVHNDINDLLSDRFTVQTEVQPYITDCVSRTRVKQILNHSLNINDEFLLCSLTVTFHNAATQEHHVINFSHVYVYKNTTYLRVEGAHRKHEDISEIYHVVPTANTSINFHHRLKLTDKERAKSKQDYTWIRYGLNATYEDTILMTTLLLHGGFSERDDDTRHTIFDVVSLLVQPGSHKLYLVEKSESILEAARAKKDQGSAGAHYGSFCAIMAGSAFSFAVIDAMFLRDSLPYHENVLAACSERAMAVSRDVFERLRHLDRQTSELSVQPGMTVKGQERDVNVSLN